MLPVLNAFCLYKTVSFYSSFATRKKWGLTVYALVFISSHASVYKTKQKNSHINLFASIKIC